MENMGRFDEKISICLIPQFVFNETLNPSCLPSIPDVFSVGQRFKPIRRTVSKNE